MAFQETIEDDNRAQERKKDHIELAFRSSTGRDELDGRFLYEPMLASHPDGIDTLALSFLGKKMKVPIWVSSMTGGTKWAAKINRRLARACSTFGMGMGLGSCRQLLDSDEHFADFDMRDLIGEEQLLYANLGIAQVEQCLVKGQSSRMSDLVFRLRADGLIVHVNPLQEWLQPEGDKIKRTPVDTLAQLLGESDYPIIVKEVGQGFGPDSMKALMKLSLAAIDFGAHGGTNFSRLEMLRSNKNVRNSFDRIAGIGHSADEMVSWVNRIGSAMDPAEIECDRFIISGGIRDFLDGYYLTEKISFPAVYGQASTFLKYAKESQEALDQFIEHQIRGLSLAKKYFRLRQGS